LAQGYLDIPSHLIYPPHITDVIMNAIITAATGYTEKDIRIFLWSVAKSCQNTKVFLIVYHRDRQSIEDICRKYSFVEPVYVSASIRKQFARLANNNRTRPAFTALAHRLSQKKYLATAGLLRPLGQLAIQIVHERFFIALQILKSHPQSFANVLLTDCRDVVIQRDPFDLLEGRLISGLEPEIIRNERYTSGWIEMAYGREILDKMLDRPVVCAGVTLGSAEKIEHYLTELCEEMWRHLPEMIFESFGYDQAAHIYLIFEKHLELELISNRQGLIATISLEDASQLLTDLKLGLLKVCDQYPAIIHQYDRHPAILDFFQGLAREPSTT
jgi:hypothetical protein